MLRATMLRATLVFAVLCASSVVGATTLRAELTAGNFRWDNANPLSGQKFVPSMWDIVDQLPPTKVWLPGGLFGSVPNDLTLTAAGESVTIPFEVVGFEYNTGSANPTKGQVVTGSVCNDVDYSSGIVRVVDGIGCTYSHTLAMTAAFNPYSFIRPVFELDQVALKAAFKGKPKGVYRGSVAVTNFYDYGFSLYSGVRSRHYDTTPITVEIDHKPAFITSVVITGDHELRTIYDYSRDVVSGKTILNGVANGSFLNGMTVSLRKSRTDYSMKGPSATTIPYSIECIGCDDPLLVNEGLVQHLQTRVPGVDTAQVNFDLKISFSDVALNTVEVGTYSDTFVLFFEPDV